MCVFTKFYGKFLLPARLKYNTRWPVAFINAVPGKEACMRDHGDVNLFLLKQPGDEVRN